MALASDDIINVDDGTDEAIDPGGGGVPVEAEEDPGAIDPPINAETPVPGALVLFGTGLAGLGLYRYRRR